MPPKDVKPTRDVQKDVKSTRDAEIMVLTVRYNNERCKNDARAVLNAIQGVRTVSTLPAGVTLENDNKDKPVRDETVTVTNDADARIPGKILQIFGSISNKKLVFNVTFQDFNKKNDALEMVNALKGVLKAEFEPVNSKPTELTLKVKEDGSAKHKIIQKCLENYGRIFDVNSTRDVQKDVKPTRDVQKDVKSTRDAEIMVFTVQYNNERCKNDARAVLNAIQGVRTVSTLPAGVTLENDNKDNPVRDETVTVTDDADARIPGKILQIFGSISNKKLVFNVTFQDFNKKNDALEMVNALKGVLKAEFEPVNSKPTELTLKVKEDGSAKHKIIQKCLENYGAQIL